MSTRLSKLIDKLQELSELRDSIHKMIYSTTGNSFYIQKGDTEGELITLEIPQGTPYYAKLVNALMDIDQEIRDTEMFQAAQDISDSIKGNS